MSSPAQSPRVQVIVVAYNSGDDLQRCIDSLEAQTFTDWEAVVWDNASTDGAVERLTIGPRVARVLCPDNLGFAAGNNRAAELSRSRYIALLNPDAFAEPTWLEHLVAVADRYGVEAVASLQLAAADPSRLDGVGDCMSIAGIPWRGGYGGPTRSAPSEICEVFSACGAAALYRRDAFEVLGGFEELFFCYCEDVDLGFRLRLSGGRCLLAPDAVVHHVHGGSSGQISGFAEYHGTRNRLWTLVRNMPWLLMPIALPAFTLLSLYLLARSPELLKIRLRALRDAFRRPEGFRARPLPRRGSLWAVVRALSWSPLAISRRSIVTRPLSS